MLLVAVALAGQQVATPRSKSGKIVRIADFKSRFVPSRTVDVWLPDGYGNGRSYPVLYMHDGQMLYDSAITWNHQAWNVDQVAKPLIDSKKIRPFIVVGVFNTQNRFGEYFPQKALDLMPPDFRKQFVDQCLSSDPQGDDYLKFLVQELKPYIDSHFETRRGRGDTFIAGSSMGGLISFYAMCEYPNIFGGAACLSTHWPGGRPDLEVGRDPRIAQAILTYLAAELPDPKNHKIYFDHGDQTLDAGYAPFQEEADRILALKGWNASNAMSRVFPGLDHSEKSWNARLDIPLTFLFGQH